MTCEELNLKTVQEEFNALWDCRIRGKSVEVGTPFVTLTNRFVTVFVTERDGEYIATDGAMFFLGDYDTEPSADDFTFSGTIATYQRYFKVLTTYDSYGNPVYYKKTKDYSVLPTLIIELAQFTQGVVNASYLNVKHVEESEHRSMFSLDANQFFRKSFGEDRVKFNNKVGKIQFHVTIGSRSVISVAKYITGSTQTYFRGSLAKANLDFELINKDFVSSIISKKITLINDLAPGYNGDVFYEALGLMENKNAINIKWSEKERLIGLLQP